MTGSESHEEWRVGVVTVHHVIMVAQLGIVLLGTVQLGAVHTEMEVSQDQQDPDLDLEINQNTRKNPDPDPSIRKDPDPERGRGHVIAEGRGQEIKDQGHILEVRSQRKKRRVRSLDLDLGNEREVEKERQVSLISSESTKI